MIQQSLVAFTILFASLLPLTTLGEPLTIATPHHLPTVPRDFLNTHEMDQPLYLVDESGRKRRLTIEPWLQNHLQQFVRGRGNPIAAVVVADAKTGHILAMVQGRDPSVWNGPSHTALHVGFPAASLFKTVVATAALELTTIDPREQISIWGGCANVNPAGVWLRDDPSPTRYNSLSLHRAYGHSCNGFFAKLSVNFIGLSAITSYAEKFGWGRSGALADVADFSIAPLPIIAPSPKTAGVHSVGRFAAGFGQVGISAVHGAWQMAAIANKGVAIPLQLFADAEDQASPYQALAAKKPPERLMTTETAEELRRLMTATVLGGTANFAFRGGKFRQIRPIVGGKTGTLTGRSPFGLTTWFTGVMPVEDPEVVVAAVVVLDKLWHIKGPNLAAEAFWAFHDSQKKNRWIMARYGEKDEANK